MMKFLAMKLWNNVEYCGVFLSDDFILESTTKWYGFALKALHVCE